MQFLSLFTSLFLMLFLVASANSQETNPKESKSVVISIDGDLDGTAKNNDLQQNNEQRLNKAYDLMRQQDFQGAIEKYLDPIIVDFEKAHPDKNIRYFSSRGMAESIIYLANSSVAADKGDENKKYSKTVIISYIWSEAFLLKANANISLGNLTEGQKWLDKAIHLSPRNASILSEMAYILITEKKYTEAFKLYEQAYDATVYTPEEAQKHKKGVALRGAGYCLIELGRLTEAEKKYRAALELNPHDQKSEAELHYIKEIRAKKFIP